MRGGGRYGYNHQTVYRRAPGAGRLLLNNGIYNQDALGWAGSTRTVQISGEQPSDHDAGLALAMSSLEIAVRQRRDLRFITHIDIIRNASAEARVATSPLSIPIPALVHEFKPGSPIELADVHVRPDALFGIQYSPADDPDFRFFALEYDRSTEDVEPTKNLLRASWLRKVLAYSAISKGSTPLYETYLKIPNLIVLCLFSDRSRMRNVMRVVGSYAADLRQFVFKAVPPIDPFLNAAPVHGLFEEPWQRLGGTFNISTLEEGR